MTIVVWKPERQSILGCDGLSIQALAVYKPREDPKAFSLSPRTANHHETTMLPEKSLSMAVILHIKEKKDRDSHTRSILDVKASWL